MVLDLLLRRDPGARRHAQRAAGVGVLAAGPGRRLQVLDTQDHGLQGELLLYVASSASRVCMRGT